MPIHDPRVAAFGGFKLLDELRDVVHVTLVVEFLAVFPRRSNDFQILLRFEDYVRQCEGLNDELDVYKNSISTLPRSTKSWRVTQTSTPRLGSTTAAWRIPSARNAPRLVIGNGRNRRNCRRFSLWLQQELPRSRRPRGSSPSHSPENGFRVLPLSDPPMGFAGALYPKAIILQ